MESFIVKETILPELTCTLVQFQLRYLKYMLRNLIESIWKIDEECLTKTIINQ